LAFHRSAEPERQFWQQALQNVKSESATDSQIEADFAQALRYMDDTSALSDTIARAAHYGEKAKDALGLFAPSQTRDLLKQLVDFCISRAY
jgi:octaprenyl-diphosphate synthase